ncbi:MAG: helix-turn-helix domain-containing protein [Candidatus Uhrbacteria bacterium]|nr:helix-turn-helix domain-containing protein [Patescibacteria group bacterium]MBU1906627.1 helix-turn-helix domain-containing protein [Patescibacteria group bacterium]
MNNSDKNLLNIGQAAKYLGISETTLRRWDKDGSFKPTFVSPGKHRFYSLADLGKRTKGLFRVAFEWAASTDPYKPEPDFYCATSDVFKTRYERMALGLDDNPSLKDIASLISSAAGEIGNNSFDHNLGNWPDINGNFFAYDFGKHIVVLADRGVGILKTLSRVKPELKSDEEALQVAFTEYITGRKPQHRGNGLKYVKNAIFQSGSSLTFLSGDSILEIKKGESKFSIKKTETPIRGTLALIEY